SDDGPANAHKALRRLQRLDGFVLAEEDSSILAAAAAYGEGESPPDEILDRLRSTRDALIGRLQHTDDSIVPPRAHADVVSMIVRVIDALTARARESAPGVDVAVAEWLAALENDPDGVREAVQHYSMVLAATCQQSVSRSMKDAKLGQDTVFRTVIVDEAARSNPLDLFIPMALAERRVILVGDHRQLPHILEPDIEREIEQSVQEETRHALRRSLFEKLFMELREREKRDGVKRTVTLNVQYRMHPLLGQFVSKQFYEPYGEGFGSGRDEREFEHSVTLGGGGSLAGKVAAWIDVPFDAGSESGGRSKARPVEARRVAREAFNVVSRHPELSVGVITFYAAQRNEIFAAMSQVGLTEPDENGGYRVQDRWRRTNDGRERLRVGTVDAFQGKEFDVVFLSLTRSNRVQVKDEVSRRRRYGFLLLENRLCVAMSRQHRLLVVVGDSSMTRGPDAESSVPGLVAFRQLCEGPSGTVIRN
ncbi:MAG: DNA/RNA helicase, partial [Deltaproteobacteria bacterium]